MVFFYLRQFLSAKGAQNNFQSLSLSSGGKKPQNNFLNLSMIYRVVREQLSRELKHLIAKAVRKGTDQRVVTKHFDVLQFNSVTRNPRQERRG